MEGEGQGKGERTCRVRVKKKLLLFSHFLLVPSPALRHYANLNFPSTQSWAELLSPLPPPPLPNSAFFSLSLMPPVGIAIWASICVHIGALFGLLYEGRVNLVIKGQLLNTGHFAPAGWDRAIYPFRALVPFCVLRLKGKERWRQRRERRESRQEVRSRGCYLLCLSRFLLPLPLPLPLCLSKPTLYFFQFYPHSFHKITGRVRGNDEILPLPQDCVNAENVFQY